MSTILRFGRRSRINLPGLVLACLVGATLPALTDRASGEHGGNGGRPLATFLSGDAEVPGPGHPEATGSTSLRLNPGQRAVCFGIEFEGIDPDDANDLIIAGHIHIGSEDVAGPVVVSFQIDGSVPVDEDGSGVITGCVSADRDLIRDIIRHPEDYYVNLHSPNFPAGAIRGQLSK